MVATCEHEGTTFTFTQKVDFVIDVLKKKIDTNKLALVAAHEIGHAVVYMQNFKVVPKQICCNGISNSDGFVIPHNINSTKAIIRKQVQIFLAGKAAEELIFGDQNISNDSCSDLYNATRTICDMIREYGFHDNIGVITPRGSQSMQRSPLITDEGDSNELAEKILAEEYANTKKLIKDNIDLMRHLIPILLEKKELTIKDTFEVANKYITGLKIIESDDNITYEYNKRLQNFLK